MTNPLRFLAPLSAMLLISAVAFTPLGAPANVPAALPASISLDRVSTCEESLYPTPTPAGAKPTPHPRSVYGPNRDDFAVAEAQQMPGGPSAFVNGKLKPDAVAPALPPVPTGQFAPFFAPTPGTTPTAYASPTVVPTVVPMLPKRVVIQAGHWQADKMPEQLSQFRSGGTYYAGKAEWQVNLDIANRTASLLRGRGYAVRIVPATVPINCLADAFISIHADGDASTSARGFKVAYAHYVNNPLNRRLLADVYIEYAAASGLPRSSNITRNMTGYYSFTARRQPYSVAPSTPMLIIELAYLTNAADRQFLLTRPDSLALGVANGIDRFLQGK